MSHLGESQLTTAPLRTQYTRATESLRRAVRDVLDALAIATFVSCFAAPIGAGLYVIYLLLRS